eukprot:2194562-Amphidinium_carterae.1
MMLQHVIALHYHLRSVFGSVVPALLAKAMLIDADPRVDHSVARTLTLMRDPLSPRRSTNQGRIHIFRRAAAQQLRLSPRQ